MHAIRDRTGADLVHLIVSDYGGLCGVAYIGDPFAYHVCDGHTFAHELGHNMGMFHDRFQVQTNEGGAYATSATRWASSTGQAFRRGTGWTVPPMWRRFSMRRERSWPGGATALPTASTGPPVTVGKLTDRRLESAGSELDLVVSQTFADPDGDPLVHAAASWTGSGPTASPGSPARTASRTASRF